MIESMTFDSKITLDNNYSSCINLSENSPYLKPAQQRVELCASSMITPVGIDQLKTAAAVRAGIDAFEESAIVDKFIDPTTAAIIPEQVLPPLSDELSSVSQLSGRQRRLLRLITLPLQAIEKQLEFDQPITLKLALPESIPGINVQFDQQFLKWVAVQSGVPIDLKSSEIFPHGRAAGIVALNAGMIALEQNPSLSVVVGGVDSYIDLKLLAMLKKEKRINSSGSQNGFIPGEAAGFLGLKSLDDNSKLGAGQSPVQADANTSVINMKRNILIGIPGMSFEQGHRYNKAAPYKGEGLAAAVDGALKAVGSNTVQTVLCTFNGEDFSGKEWGVASIRHNEEIADDRKIHHPAEFFGDIGAAFSTILIGLASEGLRRAYLETDCLVWCSSDGPLRSAVLVSID